MQSDKIKIFMKLAGQKLSETFDANDPKQRALGAQLLLSETLEYIIKGLGVIPVFDGKEITDPNALKYQNVNEPNKLEMLDGLADVAYTMYWNSEAFKIPLEDAFELVCDNNLEKFIKLDSWNGKTGKLPNSDWACDRDISWPSEVKSVEVVEIDSVYYAVGKDESGKVRKPSSYQSVDLTQLVA